MLPSYADRPGVTTSPAVGWQDTDLGGPDRDPARRATPADVVGPLFTDNGRRAGRACGARPPQG